MSVICQLMEPSPPSVITASSVIQLRKISCAFSRICLVEAEACDVANYIVIVVRDNKVCHQHAGVIGADGLSFCKDGLCGRFLARDRCQQSQGQNTDNR